jgi:replication factor A1
LKAGDVKPNMRKIDLELTIVEIEEPRPYLRRDGTQGRVTTAIGEDDSGRIKLSLWDSEIDRVKVGDRIRITNGYSRTFRDEVHVSAGLYGRLDVL